MGHIKIFILLFILDTLVLLTAIKLWPLTKSKYFEWHKKYGFVKLTTLKIITIYVVVYLSTNNPILGGFTIGYQMMYALYIFSLFRDLLKKK